MLTPLGSEAGIGSGTVLLLENSEPNAGLIHRALQTAGFDAWHYRVNSAATFITALESRKWDAVVAQFRMPEFSGYDALRIVRSTGQDIPFIFICESAGEEASIPAAKAGANDYLLKRNLASLAPVLSHEIVHALERSRYKITQRELLEMDNQNREQIEVRLSENKLAWRLMFDSNPIAQMLNLPHSTISSVNDRLVELTGYDRSELLGRTVDEIGLRVDDDLGRRFIQTIRAQGQVDGLELRVRRKDGTVLEVLVSTRSLVLDGITYHLHSFNDMTVYRRAEEAARLSQQALASVSQGVLISGADRLILSVNQAFEAMTGYRQADLVGQSCAVLQGPQTNAQTVLDMRAALDRGQEFTGELLNYRRDGTPFWNELSVNPVFGADGTVTHFVGIQRDITKLKSQQTQLKLATQVLAQGHESIIVTDAKGRVIVVNQAFTVISGYTQAEVVGKNSSLMRSGRHDKVFYRAMWKAIGTKGAWQGEVWRRRKDGAEYPEWLTISAVRDDLGAVCNYLSTSSDISEQQAARERISWLSHFDVLTGLPNLTLLADRCKHDINMAQRDGKLLAMMVLGVDRFELVNDTLGHTVGDELLKQLVSRICVALRKQDTVARVGRDEFVLLLPGDTPDGAGPLATKLLNLVAQPFVLDGNEINVTASVGIAIFPSDGLNFETLLRAAEVAMHQAKDSGCGQYRFFNVDLFETSKAEMALLAGLRTAIAQDQLQVHYQPFLDMRTGQIDGMEALLRWTHPQFGAVSPAKFIPIAERFGLISSIGAWVLRRSCRDLRDWLDRGINAPQVSVNVSPVQIRDKSLLQDIAATLQEYAIEPHRICIEVTEGALMEDVAYSEKLLRDLKSTGVKLALDDFGTGYSSLSYLKLFPFDKVKIDQSFVRNINKSAQDAVIAKVVIAMAHGLGLRVVAEGVETEAQCAFMRVNLCDEIQGYFISKPIPKDQMEAFLVEDRCLPSYLVRHQEKVRAVLVVTDDPEVLNSIKRLLKPDRYQVLAAGNGLEGLEILTRNPVDAIVTDQLIPGMTGVDFLRQAAIICPETIRVVLSGCSEVKLVADAINDGSVHRFLTMPWDDNQFLGFMLEAFQRKELADENDRLNLKLLASNHELAVSQHQLKGLLDSKQAAEVIG